MIEDKADLASGIVNVVADLLDVKDNISNAISAVLGPRGLFLVVRSHVHANGILAEMKKRSLAGQVDFICLDQIKPFHPRKPVPEAAENRKSAVPLVDLIKNAKDHEKLVSFLFGGVFLVKDTSLFAELKVSYSVQLTPIKTALGNNHLND